MLRAVIFYSFVIFVKLNWNQIQFYSDVCDLALRTNSSLSAILACVMFTERGRKDFAGVPGLYPSFPEILGSKR